MTSPRRSSLVVVLVALALAACTTGEEVTGTGDGAAAASATDEVTALVGEEATAACGEPATSVAFDRGTGRGALPPARLPGLVEPDTATCSTDWEGTPTVVNFWATWCEFCLEEMPDLQAASDRLGDRVRFVGVDQGPDNRDDALAFLDETGVSYDQVASPDGDWFDELGNRGMPTTLLVAADGEVRWRHTGPVTTDQLLELVAEHLGVTA